MSHVTNSNQKVALVTGGSRGIGAAIVGAFKKQNWRVATCATHIDHLAKSPADLHLEADVSRSSKVKTIVEKTMHEFGRIDALVNNAGVTGTNPMEPSAPDDLWHRILDVNLNGTYYLCKYAASHLPDGSGRIINIASVLALKGVPDAIAYCAAKHGVLGLTRALALHLAPRKITVNAICPGWTQTDMAHSRLKELHLSEKNLAQAVPLGRWIDPHEVADLVLYLAQSPASAMITGQALTIDGGALV